MEKLFIAISKVNRLNSDLDRLKLIKVNFIILSGQCLALFIGALCHDLDHRGKNNKFMIESASPLANMYTTSTMEHHHFNQTVAILQQVSQNLKKKVF